MTASGRKSTTEVVKLLGEEHKVNASERRRIVELALRIFTNIEELKFALATGSTTFLDEVRTRLLSRHDALKWAAHEKLYGYPPGPGVFSGYADTDFWPRAQEMLLVMIGGIDECDRIMDERHERWLKKPDLTRAA